MGAQAPPPPPNDAHAGTASASPPRPAVGDETVRRPSSSEHPPPHEGEPPPATGLTGTIVRADGTPAAGAEIEVRQLLWREMPQERAAALGAIRSGDGWFVLMREGTAGEEEEGRFLVVGLAPRPFAVAVRDPGAVASGRQLWVGGPLCTPGDGFRPADPAPDVGPGSLLAVLSAGAYGLTFSPVRFLSHPSPAEVVAGDGRVRLARRRGRARDALRDQLPS